MQRGPYEISESDISPLDSNIQGCGLFSNVYVRGTGCLGIQSSLNMTYYMIGPTLKTRKSLVAIPAYMAGSCCM